MTKKKPELPDWDDGRTVADMNVEGMPWYSPKKRIPDRERKTAADREIQRHSPQKQALLPEDCAGNLHSI